MKGRKKGVGFFDTELWKWMVTLFEIVMIAAAILLAVVCFRSIAHADTITEEVWILCEPKGTVNIRKKPAGEVFGGTTCGNKVWTDNRMSKGFIHVLELAAEEETGWISARYIVYDEPMEVNEVMVVHADGRVAVRKWVNGKIKSWVHNGDRILVYWMSSEWAVTECGYIKTEFLTEVQSNGNSN